MTENLDQVIKIIKKHRCKGILVRDLYFLLRPLDAVPVLRDLAAAGVLVMGCEFWRCVDKEKGWYAELPVGAGLIWKRMTTSDVQRNAEILTDFLTNEWPEWAEFVLLQFDDPEMDELFRKYGKC